MNVVELKDKLLSRSEGKFAEYEEKTTGEVRHTKKRTYYRLLIFVYPWHVFL